MKNFRLFSYLFVILFFSVSTHARQQDRLSGILRGELQYSMEQLQKQEVKPYYLSLRLTDQYKSVVSSSFGATFTSSDTHVRSLVPQVRVGDRRLDNYKYTTQAVQSRQGQQAPVMLVSLDDDAAESLRASIWEELQKRYDTALSVYEQTKSKLTTSAAQEDKADCFSDAPVESYYEDPVPAQLLTIDRKAWEEKLNEVSAVFRSCPELSAGSASIDYEVSRVYFVNTDGTEVVQNRIGARVMIQVSMMTDDGMELPLLQDFFSSRADSLPSTAVLVSAARDLLERVKALKDAPVANPYTGPAILSGPASGVFFHEIFGHRLEGHRLKEGGETFKDMVGKPVLPKEFQVYCDPTLERYAGKELNGHYLYDSEGVKARRVDNVVNGELKEFLMSRVPLDGFPQSNGHGRADSSKDPVSRQSNLVVETVKPFTDVELRRMLTDEAKRQGKEYGYYFRTVTSGYTTTGQGGSLNSFSVTPVEVYRVYVDGRKDELVRGVELIGTALSMFSHITSAGDTPSTFTGVCGAESGWVPVTASSPAIFVSQIETQRHQKTQKIPQLLPAPSFGEETSRPSFSDDVLFRAMNDELKRTTDSLQISGAPRPFWASYYANRYRKIDITGELGGVSHSEVTPWMMIGAVQVPIGNFKRNSEIRGLPNVFGGGLPADASYDALRRSYWGLSDAAYKVSVNSYSRKMAHLREHPLPKSLDQIADMQRVIPVEGMEERTLPYEIDEESLNRLARELSAVFLDYPELFKTSVKIFGATMDTYRLTSEGVRLKQPQDYLTVKASASFRDEEHVEWTDGMTLVFSRPSEIPPLEELKGRIRRFADDMMSLKDAPYQDSYYKGPVLFRNKMSYLTFMNRLLKPGQLIAVQNNLQQMPDAFGQRLGKTVIDPRISVVNYSGKPEYQGVRLSGSYRLDADGMKPADETVLVEKGVLKKLLNRTTPAEYAESSTGSSRFANDVLRPFPTTGFGTVHVKAEGGTVNDDKMEKELCKSAKKKQDYVYVIDTPVDYDLPRLYRMDVKTGEKLMMKTNKIKLPTLDQLEKLGAVSSQENVMNDVAGYNHSFIYPSAFIVNDYDMEKPVLTSSKIPSLTYPLQR